MIDKSILEDKLFEIEKEILNNYTTVKSIGVLGGISGLSLFEFYLGKYLNDEDRLDKASEILLYGIDRLNEGYNDPSYCNGLAGLGWTIDHIDSNGFIDMNADSFLSELDDYLTESMNIYMTNGNYDFLHGGLGIAFYFLHRLTHTQVTELKTKYINIIDAFLTSLESLASTEENSKYKWISILDRKTGSTGANFSLSHGVSSIHSFLGKTSQLSVFKERSKRILSRSINYLMTYRNKGHHQSRYPSWISPEGNIDNSITRVAWCYGDLGVGLSLFNVGNNIGNEELITEGYETIIDTCNRRNSSESCVVDSGFCHGSFGNAHIYRKMFEKSSNSIFAETSSYWLSDGLKRGTYEGGYAGFKQYMGYDRDFVGSLSLLEGIAGIGLVILDTLSDFESTWDECLLIR